MKVKVKRSGAIFIGVTVFLGVAAANTGNNLLYIIVSSMLALMLISGVSSIVNLKGIELSLIPPPEVFAQRGAPFRVVASKRGIMPSFLIRVSSGSGETLFPLIDSQGRESILNLFFERRGQVEEVKLTVSSDFPLGMFVRSMDVTAKVKLTVFPAPIPANLKVTGGGTHEEGSSPHPSSTKGYEEFRGVKEYSGEPMKLIHWKLTAKREKLLVREMLDEEREPVILTLEMVDGGIEERLSKLTYLTVKLMDMGHPVGLSIGDKEIPPAWGESHKLRILRELAFY